MAGCKRLTMMVVMMWVLGTIEGLTPLEIPSFRTSCQGVDAGRAVYLYGDKYYTSTVSDNSTRMRWTVTTGDAVPPADLPATVYDATGDNEMMMMTLMDERPRLVFCTKGTFDGTRYDRAPWCRVKAIVYSLTALALLCVISYSFLIIFAIVEDTPTLYHSVLRCRDRLRRLKCRRGCEKTDEKKKKKQKEAASTV